MWPSESRSHRCICPPLVKSEGKIAGVSQIHWLTVDPPLYRSTPIKKVKNYRLTIRCRIRQYNCIIRRSVRPVGFTPHRY